MSFGINQPTNQPKNQTNHPFLLIFQYLLITLHIPMISKHENIVVSTYFCFLNRECIVFVGSFASSKRHKSSSGSFVELQLIFQCKWCVGTIWRTVVIFSIKPHKLKWCNKLSSHLYSVFWKLFAQSVTLNTGLYIISKKNKEPGNLFLFYRCTYKGSCLLYDSPGGR